MQILLPLTCITTLFIPFVPSEATTAIGIVPVTPLPFVGEVKLTVGPDVWAWIGETALFMRAKERRRKEIMPTKIFRENILS